MNLSLKVFLTTIILIIIILIFCFKRPSIEIIYYSKATCPFCVKFEPIWEALVKKYEAIKNIKFRKVLCDKSCNTQLCSKIKSVPTILKKAGDEIFKFEGERNIETLSSFVGK
jgi:predicted DsbA family dithiol-disulfide isomerase